MESNNPTPIEKAEDIYPKAKEIFEKAWTFYVYNDNLRIRRDGFIGLAFPKGIEILITDDEMDSTNWSIRIGRVNAFSVFTGHGNIRISGINTLQDLKVFQGILYEMEHYFDDHANKRTQQQKRQAELRERAKEEFLQKAYLKPPSDTFDPESSTPPVVPTWGLILVITVLTGGIIFFLASFIP